MEESYGFLVFLGALLVWWAGFLLTMYVAKEKGRGTAEAFWMWAVFGPFGTLVVLLLPTKEQGPIGLPCGRPDDEHGEAAPAKKSLIRAKTSGGDWESLPGCTSAPASNSIQAAGRVNRRAD